MDANARDKIVDDYAITRDYFYCPSNPDWNVDGNWSIPGAPSIGYQVFAARPVLVYARYSTGEVPAAYGRSAEPIGGYASSFEEVPANTKTLHETLDDNAYYDEVASDLTYAVFGKFLNAGFGKFGSRANHLQVGDTNGDMLYPDPGGTNVSFIDGHVEWRKTSEMGQTDSPHTGKRQIYDSTSDRRYWF